LFSPEGLLEGTLGGGLLEADVQKKALLCLKNKTSFLYEFYLNEDISSEEGSICGGEVRILIDASPEENLDAFQKINQSLLQRKPGVLVSFLNKISEEKIIPHHSWIERKEEFEAGPGSPLPLFQEEIKKAFSEEKPCLLKIKKKIFPDQSEEIFLFLRPIFPLSQLVIAGAGHIGQAVSHLGSFLNFEVIVIDDRPEFANKERLPDADQIIIDDIGKAIQKFSISSDTYLVIVTRGHRYDAEALRQCLNSEAAYIGMIGSSRKINLMRKKFLEEGWTDPHKFDRVHAPIGIDIRSKTVEEIAISIAAQLVLARSQIQDKT